MRNAVFQGKDENLAVADAALRSGAAASMMALTVGSHEVLVDGDLQLDLAEQLHGEFVAAVDLGVAFLTAEALHVHDGSCGRPRLAEGLLDGFELDGWMMARMSFMAAGGSRNRRRLLSPRSGLE